MPMAMGMGFGVGLGMGLTGNWQLLWACGKVVRFLGLTSVYTGYSRTVAI